MVSNLIRELRLEIPLFLYKSKLQLRSLFRLLFSIEREPSGTAQFPVTQDNLKRNLEIMPTLSIEQRRELITGVVALVKSQAILIDEFSSKVTELQAKVDGNDTDNATESADLQELADLLAASPVTTPGPVDEVTPPAVAEPGFPGEEPTPGLDENPTPASDAVIKLVDESPIPNPPEVDTAVDTTVDNEQPTPEPTLDAALDAVVDAVAGDDVDPAA